MELHWDRWHDFSKCTPSWRWHHKENGGDWSDQYRIWPGVKSIMCPLTRHLSHRCPKLAAGWLAWFTQLLVCKWNTNTRKCFGLKCYLSQPSIVYQMHLTEQLWTIKKKTHNIHPCYSKNDVLCISANQISDHYNNLDCLSLHSYFTLHPLA